MKLLITICGRGGSKGISGKNTRLFLGRPLIDYTVAAALLFKAENPAHETDIVVSSDSDVLLERAERFRLTCLKRPAELSEDETPKLHAVRHALLLMERTLDKTYDAVIDLDITSPLRTSGNMKNALEKLAERDDTDVVFSVVPARRNPYFNMVERKDRTVRKVLDSGFTARQQAPEVFDMNASIYCYRRSSLVDRLKNSPLDGTFDIFVMRDTAVLDIDDGYDFELMEILARHFFNGEFKELYAYTLALE